jgi:putative peptidoglycan lipid II flippase
MGTGYPPTGVGSGVLGGLTGALSEDWSNPTYVGGPAPRRSGSHRASSTRPSWRTPPDDLDSPSAVVTDSRQVAIGSLVSRVTGFLRTLALGAVLGVGAGSVADPYNTANGLPTVVYELLLGGVLSAVFIPLLVGAQEQDADGGEAYTQRLLSIATAGLAAATVLAVLAAPAITWIYVAGEEKRHLTTLFALLLLPQIFFYGLGAMFAAVLNTRRVYALPAWAPVLNNLVLLGTLGLFVVVFGVQAPTIDSVSGAQIALLGLGTTAGIVVQAFCLLPALRRVGFRWRWRFAGSRHERRRTREFRGLAGWVVVYVLAGQIGLAVITRIANSHDGLSTFTYAALLFQVPYGVIGVSVLTALMPRLARDAAARDTVALVADLRLGARLSIVGLVPVTAAMMAFGPWLTSVIFVGHTTATQARLIGTVLALAAFGLLPYALVMLQVRACYALHDARTPALLNIVMSSVEIVLVVPAAVVLHGDRVIEALGAATSLSYVVGAVVGHRVLRAKIGRLGFAPILQLLVRLGVVSAVAGVGGYLVGAGADHVVGGGRPGALVALVVGAGAALVLLLAGSRVLHITEVRDLAQVLRR